MRISIKPGRSRVLAITASVLLSGSALAAAATVPARAGTASVRQPAAAAKVTVTNPGATTEPLETPIDLVLKAADTNTAGYPLTWSAPALAALGLTIAPTNANGTTAAITGTATVAEAGAYNIAVTARDSEATPVTGTTTFKLTLANTITVTNPGAQTTLPGAAITPLAIAAKDNDADATITYAAPDLPAGLAIDPTTGVISGEPTVVGVTSVTVTATDNTGAVGKAVFAVGSALDGDRARGERADVDQGDAGLFVAEAVD